MASIRQNKVERLVQKDLSEILQREIVLSYKVMVTPTVVRVSPDLGACRIYLSIFPTTNRKEAFNEVVAKAPEIRKHLGMRVKNQLRVVPELYFYLDDSIDYAERIDELLK